MKQIVSAMVVLVAFGLMNTGVTQAHLKDSRMKVTCNTKNISFHCRRLHNKAIGYNKKRCWNRHRNKVCNKN